MNERKYNMIKAECIRCDLDYVNSDVAKYSKIPCRLGEPHEYVFQVKTTINNGEPFTCVVTVPTDKFRPVDDPFFHFNNARIGSSNSTDLMTTPPCQLEDAVFKAVNQYILANRVDFDHHTYSQAKKIDLTVKRIERKIAEPRTVEADAQYLPKAKIFKFTIDANIWGSIIRSEDEKGAVNWRVDCYPHSALIESDTLYTFASKIANASEIIANCDRQRNDLYKFFVNRILPYMFVPTDKVPTYIQKQREDFLSWHKELYPYAKENECLKIFEGSGDLEAEYLRDLEKFAKDNKDKPFISFEAYEEDAYKHNAKRGGQGQDGMDDMEKVKNITKQDDVEEMEIELE